MRDSRLVRTNRNTLILSDTCMDTQEVLDVVYIKTRNLFFPDRLSTLLH